MPQKIRSFIAIPISKPVKEKVLSTVSSFRKQFPGNAIKWVDPNNIHLTVKFLGETELQNLVHLMNQIHICTENTKSFELIFSKLGSFPSKKNPRVFWVGTQINEQIKNFYKLIENVCSKDGFIIDSKPLSPHITIGRVKRSFDENEFQKINELLNQYQSESFGVQIVESFFLYKSDLRPDGPLYTILDEFRLLA